MAGGTADRGFCWCFVVGGVLSWLGAAPSLYVVSLFGNTWTPPPCFVLLGKYRAGYRSGRPHPSWLDFFSWTASVSTIAVESFVAVPPVLCIAAVRPFWPFCY